jgi:hypothetical protein
VNILRLIRATNATEIFKLHSECFDDEILNYMLADPNPFGFAALENHGFSNIKLPKLKDEFTIE